jgi:sigma-B regulation protein RsbU (phosphoserine phosphatase)
MYAALAVGILRGIPKTGQSPGSVLSVLNQRLSSRGGLRRHAAILYGLFNPQTSEMILASAGMPGPLHFSATGCRILELSGIPPGLFPGSDFEAVSITMQLSDSIVCCSDGITEAQNARDEDFGIERLIDICSAGKHLPPAELLGRIFSSVHNFTQAIRQHDDMAAAIFQLRRSQ